LKKNIPAPFFRFRNEVRAYLSHAARSLREQGQAAAPFAVIAAGRCLKWNATELDELADAEGRKLGYTEQDTFTVRQIADDLIAAAQPLCSTGFHAVYTLETSALKIAALEAEIAALRRVIELREQPQPCPLAACPRCGEQVPLHGVHWCQPCHGLADAKGAVR
jgi:hypothetical protein